MKILYLTDHKPLKNLINDYMSDLLLHGLRELHGTEVIDYPGSWYLYEDESLKRNLSDNLIWGKGFTIKNILNDYQQIDREDIESKIRNKYFDLVVYSSIRRSQLFLDEVIKYNNNFIFIDGEDDQVVESEFSEKGLYFKRELNSKKKNLLPIYFAIPKTKIIKKINLNPKNILAPLIPGKKKTYIYNNEEEYYKMYQDSLFAVTFRKGGWDCLRHYEIMMNGCLPLFIDIEKCPDLTLTNLSKSSLIEINRKYQRILDHFSPFKIYESKFLNLNRIWNYYLNFFFKREELKDIVSNNEIFELKREIVDFTKKKLTTEILAKDLLQKFDLSKR